MLQNLSADLNTVKSNQILSIAILLLNIASFFQLEEILSTSTLTFML